MSCFSVILREDGCTYNLTKRPAHTERLVPLDLIPNIIPPMNGLATEQGLAQRFKPYST